VAKVGAELVAPAEVIVTPEACENVNKPLPVLQKVMALPTTALVKVLSGAIVIVLVEALLVCISTWYRSSLSTV